MEIWFKHKTRPRMNYEWIGKTIEKKTIQTIDKTVKIKVKLPHVKPPARKRSFVQTPFFLLQYKITGQIFHAAKPLAFLLHILFRRDQNQNHNSNLTSKIMKMCEQILKKDSAPIYFKFIEL